MSQRVRIWKKAVSLNIAFLFTFLHLCISYRGFHSPLLSFQEYVILQNMYPALFYQYTDVCRQLPEAALTLLPLRSMLTAAVECIYVRGFTVRKCYFDGTTSWDGGKWPLLPDLDAFMYKAYKEWTLIHTFSWGRNK